MFITKPLFLGAHETSLSLPLPVFKLSQDHSEGVYKSRASFQDAYTLGMKQGENGKHPSCLKKGLCPVTAAQLCDVLGSAEAETSAVTVLTVTL